MGANPLDSCETDNQIFIYELGEKRGLNYITKNTNVTENKKLTLTLNRTEDDNYRRWKSFITLNFVNWLMGVIYIYIEGRSEKFKCIKHSIFFVIDFSWSRWSIVVWKRSHQKNPRTSQKDLHFAWFYFILMSVLFIKTV